MMITHRSLFILLFISSVYSNELSCEDGSFLANREDCQKYYVCVFEKLEPRECPAGLHFNDLYNICDYPQSAGCKDKKGQLSDKCPAANEQNVTFVPHNDCERYYVCDWGRLIEMNCPIGTHFNPTLNVCDWPYRAGCDASVQQTTGSPTENGSIEIGKEEEGKNNTYPPLSDRCPLVNGENVTFAGHEDCGKYYVCDWGRLIEMSCPTGLHFNPTLNVCDWPYRAGCDSSIQKPTEPPAENENENEEESENNSLPPLSDKCPLVNGENVTFVGHEDCGKYYVCDWGRLIEMSCPAGLHFNPTLNVCDWPYRAGCDSSIQKPTEPPAENENENEEEGENNSLPPLSDKCPLVNGENVTFVGHEDCGKYYVCDWGRLIEMSCPAGLNFNPTLNVCDWPYRAGCDSSIQKPTDPPAENENENEEEGENNSLPPLSDKCPLVNGENVTFVGHEDCGKYYVCDWGRLIEMSCPVGLHFNPTLNVCDWPYRAGCDSSIQKPTDPPTENEGAGENNSLPPLSDKCPLVNGENVTFVGHEDCGKYYVCDWGRLIEVSCPAGLHFNPTLNVCDWPYRAGCDSSIQIPTDPPAENENENEEEGENNSLPPLSDKCPLVNGESATLVTHEDCGKYYICDLGRLIELSCPDGLHFNPNLKACDWPHLAGCDLSIQNTTDLPAESENENEEEGENNSLPPHSDKCPLVNGENVTFVGHEDCGKYYVCDWGRLIEMSCPAGLHFNPNLNVCDWPYRAGCDSSIQNPTDPPAENENENEEEGENNSLPPLSDKCPLVNGENVTFVRHENCGKYYVCDWGRLIEMSCPAGLHFNPTLNVCDWPYRAGCDSSIQKPTDPPAENVNENEEEGENNSLPPLSDKCPLVNGQNVTFVGHEDCGKYYVCDWGRLIEMSCPAGLHFNPTLNVCDWPYRAGCDSSIQKPTDPPAENENENEGEGENNLLPPLSDKCPLVNGQNVTFVGHEDCGKYYVCDWGRLIEMSCPAGLHFNPTLNVCDWPYRAGCDSSIQIPTDPPAENENENEEEGENNSLPPLSDKCPLVNGESATLVTHEDCGKYYICDLGRLIELSCPDGLHFNPNLKACDWPHLAGCDLSIQNTTDLPAESENENEEEGENNSLPPLSDKCPLLNGENVTFVGHEDCGKYYVCDWGRLIEMSCPAGLHFNPTLNVCDWPYRAGCDSSIQKPTDPPAENENENEEEGENNSLPPLSDKCPLVNGENLTFVGHEDCGKYYVCDWGRLIEMSCPAGLHFNPNLNVCDWPYRAGCDSSIQNPTDPPAENENENEEEGENNSLPPLSDKCPLVNGENVTFVGHENCGKYYVCDWGRLIEMSCPAGLHFNPTLNVCDWPYRAGCDSSIQKPTDPPAENVNENEEEGENNSLPPLSDKCPLVNGENVTFVGHEDCGKYYVCDWGRLIEMSCPAGLHFNPTLNVCDWPYRAGCDSSIQKPTDPPAENENENEEEGENNLLPPLSDKCPLVNGENVTFVGHEDCRKYYVCDWGRLIEMSCPAGLHFNPTLNVCDWPYRAGCDSSIQKPTDPPAENENENEEEGENNSLPPLSDKCPLVNGENVTFVGHEDCGKYYVCDWGRLIEMSCPAGLHFNPNLNVCDWPYRAGCDSSIQKPTDPPAENENENEEEGENNLLPPLSDKCPLVNGENVTFVGHEDCGKYYVCDWGRLIEMSCPAGLHFNPTLNVCDWPYRAGCDSSIQKPTDPPAENENENEEEGENNSLPPLSDKCPLVNGENVTFVGHEDCGKYYVCDWGRLIEMSCPAGLHFNPTLNVCDWPYRAGCDSSIQKPTDPPAENENENEEEGENNSLPPLSDKCPLVNGEIVTFVGHEDCGKYYVCDWGRLIEMSCPAGLHFNPTLNVCDWPYRAGCDSSIQIPTDPPAENENENEEEGENNSLPPLSDKCPLVNGENVTFVGHEDCGKYHVCDWGRLIEMSCPAGLHFNPTLNVCDWPYRAGCDSSIQIPTDPPAENENENEEEGENNSLPPLSVKCPLVNGENVTFVGHEDCGKYYVCDWGRLIEMSCPAGLHFNPNLNVCDWPYRAGCDSSIQKPTDPPAENENENEEEGENNLLPPLSDKCPLVNGENVTFVGHEDCGKYYVCDWGRLIEMSCPAGLHFNPTLNVCDWPYRAGCDSSIQKPTDPPAENENENEEEGENNSLPPLSDKCPLVNGENVTFVGHEDCGKYYVCDWGRLIEMSCPAGLHFNPNLNVCDWPYRAGCDSSIQKPTDPPAENENENEEEGENNLLPPLSDKCPLVNGENVTFVGHEDCGKYYVCDWGRLIEMSCPAGLHFNPTLNVCDWPYRAGCDSSIQKPTDPPAENENENEEEGENNSLPPLSDKCPLVNGENVTFVGHEDCGKYYVCDWGRLIEMSCPAGLHFNPTLKVCDWPYRAGCDSSIQKPTDPPAENENENEEEGENNSLPPLSDKCPLVNGENVTFVGHEDCGKYYVCDWGRLIEMSCPAGLHFNPTLNVCDWPYRAGCDSSIQIPTDPPAENENENEEEGENNSLPPLSVKCPLVNGENVTFVGHEDCGKYYVCDWGRLIEMSCPAGLHFNPTLNVCDWPYRAGCDSSIQKPSDPPAENENENEEEGENNLLPPLSDKCPLVNGENVTFVGHEDCGKYYVCDWGRLIEMSCPAGLHFNPTLNVCDWPYRAGCDSSIQKPTDPPAENENENEEEGENNSLPPLSDKCPLVNGENVTFVGHEDCGKYYVCDWGRLIEMSCPAGLHFNPTLNVCDWPYRAGCDSSIQIPTDPPAENENENEEEGENNSLPPLSVKCPLVNGENVTFVGHEDCGKYYVCDWGRLIEMSCPAGLHFNPNLNVCDWPYRAGCDSSIQKPTDPPAENENENEEEGENNSLPPLSDKCPLVNGENVTFVGHEDCGKYYVCDWGRLIEMSCPAGLHFNPTLNVCDWPYRAGCDSSIQKPTDPLAENENENEEEGENNSLSPLSDKCPLINGNSATFVVHENCGKYYKCNWGRLIEMDCPEGLHFSPTQKVCTWSNEAGCEVESIAP